MVDETWRARNIEELDRNTAFSVFRARRPDLEIFTICYHHQWYLFNNFVYLADAVKRNYERFTDMCSPKVRARLSKLQDYLATLCYMDWDIWRRHPDGQEYTPDTVYVGAFKVMADRKTGRLERRFVTHSYQPTKHYLATVLPTDPYDRIVPLEKYQHPEEYHETFDHA